MSNGNDFTNLVLNALGRQFGMMVGVKNLVQGDGMLRIAFKAPAANKANHVVFRYNAGADLIDIEFARFTPRSLRWETIETVEGCFVDMLANIFEDKTGLRVRLF